MPRVWERLAAILAEKSVLVLVVTVAVTVVLGAGTLRLGFATGQDSYVNADSPVAVDNRQYQDLFGGQALVVLFQAQPGGSALDLFQADRRQQIADVAAELRRVPGVYAVVSPQDSTDWNVTMTRQTDPADPGSSPAGHILFNAIDRELTADGKQARIEDGTRTLQRISAAGPQNYDNPRWNDFLVFDNAGNIRPSLRSTFPVPPGTPPTPQNTMQAQMVIRLDGNQSADTEGETTAAALDVVNRLQLDDFTITATGSPVLLKDINDYLQRGMAVLGLAAVVVMIVVLSLVFRVRGRLVPLLAMAIGLLWSFGALGWAGFQLSIVTIAGLPILIGLGVEFAIQVHNRLDEEVTVTHAAAPARVTMRRIGPALLVATVAAVLACLTLRASPAPMIRDFGVLLAVGIVGVFLSSLLVPTALIAERERRSPTTAHHEARLIEGFMTRLGHAPRWLVGPIAVGAVVLFAIGLAAEQNTPIQTDPEQWVDQDAAVIKDLRTLNQETGTSGEFGVFLQDLERGVFTDEMGKFVTDFSEEQLATQPLVATIDSLPAVISDVLAVPGATNLDPTGDDMRTGFDAAPPDIAKLMVGDQGRAANMAFITRPSTLDQRSVLIADVREDLHPPAGISATPAGLEVIGVELLGTLTEQRLLLTSVAVALVALWFLIRLRNLVKVALVMVPVLLAVGVAATVVKITGITVSPLTVVSGPLVIAVCGEFTVLILFRHLEERGTGLEPRAAIDVAAARTGRAFFASSLTTVGGFLVMLLSPLPLIADFGAIVAITITIALVSAITAVPPLLVFADEHGWLHTSRDESPEHAESQGSFGRPKPADAR